MTNLKYSEIESKRFEREIYRGAIDELDIDLLRAFYAHHDQDTLIFRIPVAEQHKMHMLNGLGKEVINADTLVYYEADLQHTESHPIRNTDIDFRHIADEDKGVFEELIPKIFNNYTNHYFSNPVLDKTKIAEGYMEWVMNSFGIPGNLYVVAYRDDQPIAFITCSHNAAYAEIVLNGVLPQYQKGGVYADLIRYVKQYFGQLGTPLLRVSTQIQNFPVQRVWNKEGFVMTNAFVTVHLNKK